MDVEGAKVMFENLDVIAGMMDDEDTGHGSDMLADVLLSLTGMTRVRQTGDIGLDVRTRDQANRVAVRWLRTNGYLSRVVDAHGPNYLVDTMTDNDE